MTFATCLLISLVLWGVGYISAGVPANPGESKPHYLRPPRLLRIVFGMPKGNPHLAGRPIHRTSVLLLVSGEVSIILAWFLKDENWVLHNDALWIYMIGGLLIGFLISSFLLRAYPYANSETTAPK